MSALVILLLAALWGAILLPSALRARRQHHPVASVDGFTRAMTTLAAGRRPPSDGPGTGGAVDALRDAAALVPVRVALGPPVTPAVRRRRAILAGLVAAVTSTTVLGSAVGGFAWVPAVVSVAALAAYLGLLVAFVAQRTGHGNWRAARLPSAVESAARAEAVRAAVVRAPAGTAPEGTAPAGSASPGPAPAGTTRSGRGPAGPEVDVGAAGALVSGSTAQAAAAEPLPGATEVQGNPGLVSIRSVPRAGH